MNLNDSALLRDLPVVGDDVQRARVVPKASMTSRVMERKADDKAYEKAWEACKRKVDRLDEGKCRCCGRVVKKVLRLCAERAEHHHVTRRSAAIPAALLTDVRNVLLLCQECHDKVTRGVLHLVGTAKQMFTFEGKSYLNARLKLRFVA